MNQAIKNAISLMPIRNFYCAVAPLNMTELFS